MRKRLGPGGALERTFDKRVGPRLAQLRLAVTRPTPAMLLPSARQRRGASLLTAFGRLSAGMPATAVAADKAAAEEGIDALTAAGLVSHAPAVLGAVAAVFEEDTKREPHASAEARGMVDALNAALAKDAKETRENQAAIRRRRGLQSDPLLRGLVAGEHEGEGKDGGPEGGGWAAAERPPGGGGAGDGPDDDDDALDDDFYDGTSHRAVEKAHNILIESYEHQFAHMCRAASAEIDNIFFGPKKDPKDAAQAKGKGTKKEDAKAAAAAEEAKATDADAAEGGAATAAAGEAEAGAAASEAEAKAEEKKGKKAGKKDKKKEVDDAPRSGVLFKSGMGPFETTRDREFRHRRARKRLDTLCQARVFLLWHVDAPQVQRGKCLGLVFHRDSDLRQFIFRASATQARLNRLHAEAVSDLVAAVDEQARSAVLYGRRGIVNAARSLLQSYGFRRQRSEEDEAAAARRNADAAAAAADRGRRGGGGSAAKGGTHRRGPAFVVALPKDVAEKEQQRRGRGSKRGAKKKKRGEAKEEEGEDAAATGPPRTPLTLDPEAIAEACAHELKASADRVQTRKALALDSAAHRTRLRLKAALAARVVQEVVLHELHGFQASFLLWHVDAPQVQRGKCLGLVFHRF